MRKKAKLVLIPWTWTNIKLEDFQRLKRNPKAHDLGALHGMMKQDGFLDTVTVNARTGRLIGGHGRIDTLQQKKALGEGPPQGIGVDEEGSWLVPTWVVDVPEDREETVAIGLNRSNELGGWEATLAEVLSDIAAQGQLEGSGYDEEDLDRMIADQAGLHGRGGNDAEDPRPQVDRAEELRKQWSTELGQVWEVGAHRIWCSDLREVFPSWEKESIDFIWTDPPYGHNNNEGDLIHNREKALGKPEKAPSRARPIANDGPQEAMEVYSAMLEQATRLLKPGCCCCCCGGGGGPDPQFARWSLEMDRTIGFKHAVVWDKGGLGMGWHYRRCYELVLVGEKSGAACHWFGGNDVPNVIRDIGKIIPSADQHPTEKPVALVEWFLRLHSQPGEIVLDPFLGSGTTLVACEKTGRRGRGIELSPAYVAVALERLTGMGLEARRL